MAVKKRPKSLSHGRPPVVSKHNDVSRSLTSKATRTLIRTHHRLQKQHAAALRAGDNAKATELSKVIEDNGGLELYQAASIKGQSAERGGDSSRVLVQWLKERGTFTRGQSTRSDFTESDREITGNRKKKIKEPFQLKVLEVGALSPLNAISSLPGLNITCIDLHSQHPTIETQDFMERPIPNSDEEKFDIISLSLVLNYVPDAVARGEMLRRTCKFLRLGKQSKEAEENSTIPALFLVLPAPCVMNSRYLTEEHLTLIMDTLGFVLMHNKLSAKLVYYLWRYQSGGTHKPVPKKSLRAGGNRNNFCMILE
jgi:25S rRNA (adenine2142-N1)-methyltransferase